MPKPDELPSAVVVSGGKQYRVIPGDRLLVDRLGAEPGAELELDRLLMVADGDEVKLGADLGGLVVMARVVEHRRGPKIAVLRYKAKKRVRVHRGARADLTLLEILEVAGRRLPEPEKAAAEKEAPRRGRLRRRRREAEPEEPMAVVSVATTEKEEPAADAPRPRRSRSRKPAPPEAEADDGA